jgi:hypothetical protein
MAGLGSNPLKEGGRYSFCGTKHISAKSDTQHLPTDSSRHFMEQVTKAAGPHLRVLGVDANGREFHHWPERDWVKSLLPAG